MTILVYKYLSPGPIVDYISQIAELRQSISAFEKAKALTCINSVAMYRFFELGVNTTITSRYAVVEYESHECCNVVLIGLYQRYTW